MGLFKKIFGTNEKGIDLAEQELLEIGVCPNCWGKQEYAGEYQEYTASHPNPDNQSKKAFVQQFVEKNITGIKLKKDGDVLLCSKCDGKHKIVSSKAN